MKVYLAIKYHEDNSNEDLILKLLKELESAGIETISVMRDFEQWGKVKYAPKELMELSFEQIDSCDALILEFSEKGVGLGIEAGYCFAKKIPIFLVAKQGAEISETLQGIIKDVCFYHELSELEHYFSKIKRIL